MSFHVNLVERSQQISPQILPNSKCVRAEYIITVYVAHLSRKPLGEAAGDVAQYLTSSSVLYTCRLALSSGDKFLAISPRVARPVRPVIKRVTDRQFERYKPMPFVSDVGRYNSSNRVR